MNTWKRKALAFAAVALLSVPSAIGVQRALAPTRGELAGWLAAAGFEAVYLATAVLILSSDLRRYAQRVALAAVGTAVLLNTLADYAHRVPGGLDGWPQFRATFDALALGLSLVESVPLAGLSYAMATLLHRLAEQPTRAEDDRWLDRELSAPAAPSWAGPVVVAQPASYAREAAQPVYPAPVAVRAPIAPLASDAPNRLAPSAASVAEAAQGAASNSSNAPAARDYACRHCGATGLTKAEQLAHGRARKRHGSCNGAQVSAAD